MNEYSIRLQNVGSTTVLCSYTTNIAVFKVDVDSKTTIYIAFSW